MVDSVIKQDGTAAASGSGSRAAMLGDISGRFGGLDWRAEAAKFRQPGPQQWLIIGLACALLSMAVVSVLWWQQDEYGVLYRHLSEADAAAVVEALEREQIPYRLGNATGLIEVPADSVHRLRLKLAGEGLPKAGATGFELLDEQSTFGVSQFMENARYQRALEGELARSIASLDVVQSARVHLALPRESVFIRERRPPSASVVAQLMPGRRLSPEQVASIVQLVTASVPRLTDNRVAVVDQHGQLLSRPGEPHAFGLSDRQLDYTRSLEAAYAQRVEEILAPIVGLGRVHAQVALDLDFSVVDETDERFAPNQPPGMIRSERVLEERDAPPSGRGIPGALSNEPPGVAEAPEQLPDGAVQNQPPGGDAALQANGGRPQIHRAETLRNYEIDRRIVHTRKGPGRINRLTAAVAIDERLVNEDGSAVAKPLSDQELARITALVQRAVGFNEERGDSVEILNMPFAPVPTVSIPLWEQAGFMALLRWILIATVLGLLVYFVLRPLASDYIAKRKEEREQLALAEEGVNGNEEGLTGTLVDGNDVDREEELKRLREESIARLEQRLTAARSLVAEDPKRAVQVVKAWMAEAVE